MTEEDFQAADDAENSDAVDVGDPKKVRKARKAKRAEEQRKKEDLQAVLATATGRRFIWHMLGECKLYDSTIGLPGHTVRERSGMREIGLRLLEQVSTADPKSAILMQVEAANPKPKED